MERDKLRIWFVSTYDSPIGQSCRTYDFATALTERGHDVTFFTSSYSHHTHQERLDKGVKWQEEYFGKVRVIWLKTFPYRGNGWQRAINMISSGWRAFGVGRKLPEKPNVIIGPSVPLFTGLVAYFLSKVKNCQFCFEVRDIWPQSLIDLGVLSPKSPATFIFKIIEKYLYLRAKKIIVVLPFAYKHICKYGIPPDKIIWIPNGINFSRFSSSKSYDGGNAHSLVAMYVGGFATTHDVETIIHAANILRDINVTNIRFVVVGYSQDKNKYKKLLELGAANGVQFQDTVPKEDISKVLEEGDVLIASVKDTPVYQFGINSNKILDYFASGRPIIFAVNSPNDPVKDANAGLSIPPEDPKAMSEALKTFLMMSPEERKRLGQNGLEYGRKNLDVQVLVQTLERVLLEVNEYNMED